MKICTISCTSELLYIKTKSAAPCMIPLSDERLSSCETVAGSESKVHSNVAVCMRPSSTCARTSAYVGQKKVQRYHKLIALPTRQSGLRSRFGTMSGANETRNKHYISLQQRLKAQSSFHRVEYHSNSMIAYGLAVQA